MMCIKFHNYIVYGYINGYGNCFNVLYPFLGFELERHRPFAQIWVLSHFFSIHFLKFIEVGNPCSKNDRRF